MPNIKSPSPGQFVIELFLKQTPKGKLVDFDFEGHRYRGRITNTEELARGRAVKTARLFRLSVSAWRHRDAAA